MAWIKKPEWNLPWRAVVFLLAASSIACLLMELYGLCPMRQFVLAIFFPALLALAGLAVWDWVGGSKNIARAILIGTVAGLVAAVAYDIFRLPFVYSKTLHLESWVPPLNLFKVFP